MARKDRTANVAGRAVAHEHVKKWTMLHANQFRAVRQLAEAGEEKRDRASIREILDAVKAVREDREREERELWDMLAAASAAGATQGQIAAACGVSIETVRKKFLLRPVARARGTDFVRTEDGSFKFHPVEPDDEGEMIA